MIWWLRKSLASRLNTFSRTRSRPLDGLCVRSSMRVFTPEPWHALGFVSLGINTLSVNEEQPQARKKRSNARLHVRIAALTRPGLTCLQRALDHTGQAAQPSAQCLGAPACDVATRHASARRRSGLLRNLGVIRITNAPVNHRRANQQLVLIIPIHFRLRTGLEVIRRHGVAAVRGCTSGSC